MDSFSDEWYWVKIVGGIFAFIAAFGIGANDLANSFGSSVGTKALTMWQCVIIAAIMEFFGAFLLGAGVTDTIKSGVARSEAFTRTPEILMIGMLGVLITGAIWDNLACHLGLPVSTTHTTVGAIIGMSLVSYGKGAVIWKRICDEGNKYCGSGSLAKVIIPIKGFVPIILSWFFSPVLAGLLVTLFYSLLRTFVLRSEHSFSRALMVVPWCMGFTIGLIVAFIIQTGAKNSQWKEYSDWTIAVIAVITGIVVVIISYGVVFGLLRRSIMGDEEEHNERVAAKEKAMEEEGKFNRGETEEERQARIADLVADLNRANKDIIGEKVGTFFKKFSETTLGGILLKNPVSRVILYGSTYDVHEHGLKDEDVARIWAEAEVFDFKTERLFRYLQVFSACVMSFAHGSNDVANAMGPFSAIVYIVKNGTVPKKSPVPKWILVLGGIGIVTGLATYGYHITRVIGVKAVKLTNTRGFCAELATAFVVVMASRLGIPVSTTQTIIGAVFALGLFEGLKGVNWKLVYTIFLGWVATLVLAGGLAGLIQTFVINSPNKTASVRISTATRKHYFPDMLAMIKQMNSSSSVSTEFASQLLALNTTLTKYAKVPYNFPGLYTLQSELITTYNSSSCQA